VEPHTDAVVDGGSVPSAVSVPLPGSAGPAPAGAEQAAPAEVPASSPAAPAEASASSQGAPAEAPAPRRGRRVAAPSGVPTAADLAAAHAATEWDHYEERDLLGAAESLRAEVASLPLPLEVPDVEHSRAEREALLGQLDDYLLPRLRRLDAPVLAVVGGSTGAGKSTLVNSIARREVTRSGVLRPTTRSPVLVHHPYDSGAFLSQRVLPGLARVTSEAPEPAQPIDIDAPRVTALRLVPHDGITPGLAVIDAPDIDSVVEANRDLAVQLLAAADLWVFVTTATRYSDNVPWQMLRQAVDRGVAVAVVLDRVPLDVMQEVRTHLATLLRDRGLGTSPMFTIPETTLEDGFLPVGLVAPLAGWLRRLALDARSRDVVVRRTLIGVLDSLNERVHAVAAAADAQAAAEAQLRKDVDSCYDAAHEELRRSIADGGVVRGEVLARWHEFVTTGDVFRSLEPGATTWRDRLRVRMRAPRVAPAQPLLDALQQGLEGVVLARVRATTEGLDAGWGDRRPVSPTGSAGRCGSGARPWPTSCRSDPRPRRTVGRPWASTAPSPCSPSWPSARSRRRGTSRPRQPPSWRRRTGRTPSSRWWEPLARTWPSGRGGFWRVSASGFSASWTPWASARVAGRSSSPGRPSSRRRGEREARDRPADRGEGEGPGGRARGGRRQTRPGGSQRRGGDPGEGR
jgi:hypothetical protein